MGGSIGMWGHERGRHILLSTEGFSLGLDRSSSQPVAAGATAADSATPASSAFPASAASQASAASPASAASAQGGADPEVVVVTQLPARVAEVELAGRE